MKKTRRKSRLTVPLKRIRKSHLTQRSMILHGTSKKFIRISRRKRNQKQNYFNPLVTGQWPRPVRSMKKKLKISLDCPFKGIIYSLGTNVQRFLFPHGPHKIRSKLWLRGDREKGRERGGGGEKKRERRGGGVIERERKKSVLFRVHI